jgi:lipoprotein-anchoring transpeptidase ErfK/SrfK
MNIISKITAATAFAAATAAATLIAATACASTASANPFEALFGIHREQVQAPAYQSQGDDGSQDEARSQDEAPSQFRRQVVDYRTSEAPGTIIIDTPNTYLYLVMPGGKAMRYGIGVGREGFTWAGTQTITRKQEWPDWTPPEEMLQRQPYLPRFMAGGPGNPMGARAMYLGSTMYRIHGTNAPDTIGQRVSSGCIRLTNDDVEDLYSRVNVGTKVIVRPINGSHRTAAAPMRIN